MQHLLTNIKNVKNQHSNHWRRLKFKVQKSINQIVLRKKIVPNKYVNVRWKTKKQHNKWNGKLKWATVILHVSPNNTCPSFNVQSRIVKSIHILMKRVNLMIPRNWRWRWRVFVIEIILIAISVSSVHYKGRNRRILRKRSKLFFFFSRLKVQRLKLPGYDPVSHVKVSI